MLLAIWQQAGQCVGFYWLWPRCLALALNIKSKSEYQIKKPEIKTVKVINYEAAEKKPVEMQGASGCSMRQLVTDQDGAPNFAMRQFEVEPGGHTPLHSHPYEHEVFVLEGNGAVIEGDQKHPIQKGDVIYVAPDDIHQFQNTGTTPMKFLCMVPNDFVGKPINCAVESSAS